MRNIKILEEKIDYKFSDKKLLLEALTHSSFANENKDVKFNERLEFLGDSVLSLIITSFLFSKEKDKKEGVLSKIRATIVCEKSLRNVGDKFELNKFILLGKGEESTGGRNKDSIIADAVEALIGAIYLDSSLENAQKFVFNFMSDIITKGINGELYTDYKTEFQEILQKEKECNIRYIVVNEEGPDHNKVFTVELIVNDEPISKGVGRSKKDAEQNAAKEALRLYEK